MLINIAHAQTAPDVNVILNALPPTRFTTVYDLILGISNWLFGFVGLLAVISLVYSGVMYLTAGANSDQADKAKKNITWAITGIIIAVGALLILNLVHLAVTR